MKKDKKISKYGLLKTVGIAFLLFAILTWIIPAGMISNGTYTESTSGTVPVGILGLFVNPIYSFGVFVQYFTLLLSIGGLYGVLNKTGVYSKIVDSFGKNIKNHKALWLIIITTLITLISSVVGNQIALFIVVPFIVAALIKGGLDKLTALGTTVGAILVGVAGSMFGTDAISVNFFGTTALSGITTKLIYFVLITTMYILFLLVQSGILFNKKKKLDISDLDILKKEEIPLYEENDTKKSSVPLIVIGIILMLLLCIGCVNWDYSFDVTLFTDLNTKVQEITLLYKFLGYLPVFGYLGNYDITAIILVFTFLIKWIYSIKFDEFIDSYKDGVKQMLRPALYAILVSTIFAVIVNSSDGYSISATISNYILGISDKFYVLIVTLLGFVGGFFFNDFAYLVNSIYSSVVSYGAGNTTIMMILLQTGYALGMLCLPVSVVLIPGLRYLNVSYKEWMKYIYKFLLMMFVLVIVFGLIALAL